MYFVWSADSGQIQVHMLDGAFQPVGEKKLLGLTEFKKKYTREPSILAVPVSANARPWLNTSQKSSALSPHPAQAPYPADNALNMGELLRQSIPQGSTIAQQTEIYLRNFFGKALKRIKFAQERSAALLSLRTVVEVEEGIVAEHRFMFADFGVALRKSDLLELSLTCCKRVLLLSPEDDHAHFNIARIFFEMNKLDEAEQHLLTAQDMNPSEPVYTKMLDYIQHERRRRGRPQKISVTARKTRSNSIV
ncbi:MAG: tetratricopeptide repeat protein [Desulfovibrionaceae bacterium]